MDIPLTDDFDGFQESAEGKFSAKGVSCLALPDIKFPAVVLESAASEEIKVSIDADDAGLKNIFMLYHLGSNSIIIGEDIKPTAKVSQTPRIKIYAPKGIDLKATLTDHAKLVSHLFHKNIELTVRKSAQAMISGEEMRLSAFNDGKITATTTNADVEAKVADNSVVKITGGFRKIRAYVRGSGKLTTSGALPPEYYAEAHDTAEVLHLGPQPERPGSITRITNGEGKISFPQIDQWPPEHRPS